MTATTTDVREWAKARGIDIGAHGRIPGEVRAQYDAEHAGTIGEHEPSVTLEADYDAGVSEADFITADEPEPEPPGHPAEVRPRRIKTTRPAGGVLARWRKPKTGGTKTTRPAKRLPRVSLAGLIEDAWSQLAWAAAPLPPMQRLLYAQAPFAGVALEHALAGTVVDRVLQPAARLEEKAKEIGGLVMPPLNLLAVLATAPQSYEVRNESTDEVVLTWPEPSVQHKAALMGFRWSLMLMAEVGQMHLEEYKAKAEAAEARGAEADKYMAWILGVDLPEEKPVREEEEAVRRAQAMFGGET